MTMAARLLLLIVFLALSQVARAQVNDLERNHKSTLEQSAVRSKAANDSDDTFFSTPNRDDTKLPRYRADARPGEKIRQYIQASTPELEQLKLIGSLTGKHREEVVKTYEKERAELQPLINEFNELRKKMSGSLTERMLSQEEPQMDMSTKPEDFELLLKARNMLQRLRSKRLSMWEEIQAKLSPTQLEELGKLKSGQVPADYSNTRD